VCIVRKKAVPIYEYRCRECGEVTEALVRMGSEPDLACQRCGSRELERKFSIFGTAGSSSGASGDSCTQFT